MTNLERYIKEKGSVLSGELLALMTNGEKPISDVAARKRLTRLSDNIYKLKGFFADGQILFYDKEIFGTKEYENGLIEAFKNSGKQYYIILQSLDFHSGQIRLSQLPDYSISPIIDLKGHVTFATVLETLERLRLIRTDNEYVILSSSISEKNHNQKRAKGIEVAKDFLLIQFNDWIRKIGLVAYNSSKFHSELGKYQFNFVAPSYVGNLTKQPGDKTIPAFVVADILIGGIITESQIEFFVNKITVLKFLRNIPHFIPILIVDSLEESAFNKLKANGVVIGFINELFGDTYRELLNSLINLVTNAGAILKKNPSAYLDLISTLDKLVAGKTNNLRGDLFELAVGYYQGQFCSIIDIGKQIIFKGKIREIDVFGLMPNGIIICECKGYNHPIQKDEVDRWLGETISIVRNWILDQDSLCNREIVFEFWSTGGYSDEAKLLLEKRKVETKKYKIEYYDLDDMIRKSKDVHSKKFTQILREYYIKSV